MIEVQGLSKTFHMYVRGGAQLCAFRNISFHVAPGEFVGIRGPSGAGKSSLLKCLYRTYLPTEGEIWYTDASSTTHNLAAEDEHVIIGLRRQEIGYVSQFFPVIPRVSALDTITNGMVARGFARAGSEERARSLLARLGIPPALWDMFPSTFSGGEKQRLNIIHAIITEPRLLLLDEPTASLDMVSAGQAVELIQELKARGTAMIGVFHDPALLTRLSDRVLEMSA